MSFGPLIDCIFIRSMGPLETGFVLGEVAGNIDLCSLYKVFLHSFFQKVMLLDHYVRRYFRFHNTTCWCLYCIDNTKSDEGRPTTCKWNENSEAILPHKTQSFPFAVFSRLFLLSSVGNGYISIMARLWMVRDPTPHLTPHLYISRSIRRPPRPSHINHLGLSAAVGLYLLRRALSRPRLSLSLCLIRFPLGGQWSHQNNSPGNWKSRQTMAIMMITIKNVCFPK